MRAALIAGGRVEFREFAPPQAQEGGVVVDIAFCGLCGTDLHAYLSGAVYNPAICGHEWTGTVGAVGDKVTGLAEGDRVVVAVPPACGRCLECERSLPERCRVSFAYALGRDERAPAHGGFASSIAVDAGRVLRVHPGLADEEAAQVEPATIALHAVRRSRLAVGDVAVVQGAGPIGLLVMQFVRAAGARTVIVIEPSEARRRLARELGADAIVSPGQEATEIIAESSDGLGADTVYECVGQAQLLQTAVDLARQGGSVTMVGYPNEWASIDAAGWMRKEISVTTSLAYNHDDFEMAMAFMADGRVRVGPLHTRTVGLDELEAALVDLGSGRSVETKILVDPRR
jgi:(R,R)-butanediol dehydrogenase / meso-butanediol dehydrogenase / diacetyl reductase